MFKFNSIVKTFSKFVSIVLSIALFVTSYPLYAFANGITEYTYDENEVIESPSLGDFCYLNPYSWETSSEDATILSEDEDLRTEYSKTYNLSNGLSMLVSYAVPIHKEVEGVWEEIDNSLVLSNGNYVTANSNVEISLPGDISTGVASVSQGEHTLGFKLLGQELLSAENILEQIKNVTSKAVSSSKAFVKNSDHAELIGQVSTKATELIGDKLFSKATYESVFGGVNIEYTVTPTGLKESIVISKFSPLACGYAYRVDASGMNLVLQEDNSILAYSKETGEELYCVSAPFLEDAEGERNTDIETMLVKVSTNSYILMYILPGDWMQSATYPVVLDPTVYANSGNLTIEDIAVAETNSDLDTFGYNVMYLRAGKDSYYGRMRSFIKFTDMPSLKAADVITEAKFTLYTPIADSTSMVINVHEVLESWSSNTNGVSMTWANQPEFSSTIQDYQVVAGSGTYEWDVTDIAREWFVTGINTGIAITANDESNVSGVKKFYSSDIDSHMQYPTLSIFYLNNTGLEDYWDYTSVSCKRAGVGYINNFTGNLVWIHPDMGYDGLLAPVNIQHVYNANDAQDNRFGMGFGWRTNYNQLVYKPDSNIDRYVWEDEDGTRHYFDPTGTANEYEDKEGLGITLKRTASGTKYTYTLTDASDNVAYFDTEGRLYKIKNDQQTTSCIEIKYTSTTSKQISQVIDGAGRKYNFAYNSSGLLTSIKYYAKGSTALNTVSYEYNSSKELRYINYSDGNGETLFSYTTNHLMSMVMENSEYRLSFSYNTRTVGLPNRIISVTERDNSNLDSEDTEDGGGLYFKYDHNQTTVTDKTGRKIIYQFNYWGNTICTQDDQGNAVYSGYTSNDREDSGIRNQLRLSSNMQNTVGNKITQPRILYYDDYWFGVSGYYGGTRTDGTISHTGVRSIKLSRTETDTAYNAWQSDNTIVLEVGESATFSAYVNTDELTGNGFYLVLGTSITASTRSEKITNTSGQWERFEVTYTNTGTGSVTVRPYLLLEGVGSVCIDSLQLEKTSSASRFNYIDNGDLNCWGTSTSLTGWVAKKNDAPNSSAVKRVNISNTISGANSPAKVLDSYCMQIIGDPSSRKYAEQTITVSGIAGDSYVLSGWGRGDSAPLTGNRTFGLKIEFWNNGEVVNSTSVSFNPDMDATDLWQYISTGIVAEGVYTAIKVTVQYDYNVNTAYFDGIQLFKEGFGTVYSYGENNEEDDKLTGITDDQGNKTEISYNTEGEVDYVEDAQENSVQYTYDDYGNVLTAAGSDGITYTYTYNEYGLLTSTTVTNSNDNTTLTSSTEYSDLTSNYVKSETDTDGNTTLYGYNEDTGLLMWIQYPEDTGNTRTTYTYDSKYNLVSTTKHLEDGREVTVSTEYTSGLQTSITHSNTASKSTTYSMEYYNFDLLKNIKAGNRTLVTYTYNNLLERELSSLSYGNGATEEYAYDSQGQLISITYNGDSNKTVTYTYDSLGNVTKEIDTIAGVERIYKYSEYGQIIRYTEKNISSGNAKYSVYYVYNTLGQLTKETHFMGEVSYTYQYTYDSEGKLTKTAVVPNEGSFVSQRIDYDSLGRIQKIYTKENEDNPNAVTYQITYEDDSNRVERWYAYGGLFDNKYDYNYDKNGNITEIYVDTDEGTYEISYEYDTLGQLVRVNDQTLGTAGETWTYSYDLGGNITSKSRYAFTIGTLGTALETISFTYGDATWGDLLTEYNGQEITYDQIGNPLSDGTWDYTWEYGRQLATQSSGNITWTYDYDASGQRITRTNGNTTYEYGYYGSTLVYEKITQGNTTVAEMYITYGETGPLYIDYNGTIYYYILNGQGDVVGLARWDEPVDVTYSYNAWGELESVSGTLASTLGVHNPLRYRGYVYDTETYQYYLNSRYYNPEWGRFINADDVSFLGATGTQLSYNLFVYCENNPVNACDPTGNWLIQAVCGVAGVAIFGTVANVLCRLLGVDTTVKRLITAGFALLGGILGAAFGPSIVGKIAPKALEWVNKLEKIINSKSNFRPIIFEGQTVIGFEYNNIKIMIHPTHIKEPQKGWHIAIQHKTPFGNWRPTIPDIPLKEVGKVFMNWAKRWLK